MTMAGFSGGKSRDKWKNASNMKGKMMKVYEAISSVAKELSEEGIGKNRRNDSQKYAFRGIDDVLAALCLKLTKYGLVIVPRVVEVTREQVVNKNGTVLIYSTARVEYDFVSVEDGSKHTACGIGEGMDSGDKASNKAMSAAYKYMALQTFCVPVEGMVDSERDDHELQPANRYARCHTIEELQAAFGADYQAAKDMGDRAAACAAKSDYEARKEELTK